MRELKIHMKSVRTLFFLSLVCLAAAIPQHSFGQPLQWRNLTPQSGLQPEARRYGTAIYDPVALRIVLFGGLGISGFLNDLWAFNLTTKSWTRLDASDRRLFLSFANAVEGK